MSLVLRFIFILKTISITILNDEGTNFASVLFNDSELRFVILK
jgi:hypothetical protein